MTVFSTVSYIDSHTAGEPTRLIIDGEPFDPNELESAGAIRNQLDRESCWMRAVTAEPRGREALVGVIASSPFSKDTLRTLTFFNAQGTLGMCGHGLIGVAQTFHWQGLLASDQVKFDTPVGLVSVKREVNGSWTISNVSSYVLEESLDIEVDGIGLVQGSVAYGGNWFYLVHNCQIPLISENHFELVSYSKAILKALSDQGQIKYNGASIDHIEICSEPTLPSARSKNFVLCPDGSYDRSPCGTGTSAHIAYQAYQGRLKPGEIWVQESFTGSIFSAQFDWDTTSMHEKAIIPTINGRASVVGRGELFFEPQDLSISQ